MNKRIELAKVAIGIGILAWISGCSSFKASGIRTARDRVFPNGTYTHQVTLDLPNHQSHRFRGIVSLSDRAVNVVGLSFFNTTAFRLTEDLASKKVDAQIYVEPMKKYEPKLREYYGLLRELLRLPVTADASADAHTRRRASDGDGYPLEVAVLGALGGNGKDLMLHFSDYDDKKIPRKMSIDGGAFSVHIEVTGYEIESR